MQRDKGISYTRVIAMIFILTDHIVMKIDIPFKSVIIQITNTGVLIFLFISGFLYGRKEIDDFKQWFIKRAKKILIPLYVFMIFLIIIQVINKEGINWVSYFKYLINMQGLLGVIQGAVHLWFLTALMLCYLITPLLQKGKKIANNINFKEIVLIFILSSIIQIVCAYFINIKFALGHSLSTYLIYIFAYIFGYYYSYYNQGKEINNKKMIIFTFIMIISMIIRVISNKLIDGTILYDRIISMQTNLIFAIYISILIKKYYILVNCKKIEKIINNLDALSFEIYIVHGISIEIFMNVTNNIVINVVSTLISAYIIAFLFKKICSFVNRIFLVERI